jgi:hypothetical protein
MKKIVEKFNNKDKRTNELYEKIKLSENHLN